MHPIQGSLVPLDFVGNLVVYLLDLCDCPRPTTQMDVGKVLVDYAVLDSNLVPNLEARDDRSFFRVRHGSLLGGIVRSFAGDVGDQAFLKGDLLEHSWACSDVRHEAIDLHHPDHRAVVHATRQRPMMIELRNLEHGADGFRFALAGAFADPERLVDGRQLHVRLVTAVVKKVDPTNCANDPTRPGLRLATKQGRRAFAGQLLSQTATQNGILFIELLPAELVRHCDNQFKNRADFHRTLARCFALCHVSPVLVFVRESMSIVGVFYVSGTDQLTVARSLGSIWIYFSPSSAATAASRFAASLLDIPRVSCRKRIACSRSPILTSP